MANWPSRIDFRLSEAAAEEVSFFADNADKLAKIIDSVSKQSPKTDLQDIVEEIASDIGLRAPDVRQILNSLENLKDLSEDLGTYEEAITRLTKAVNEDISRKLEFVRPLISEALRRYADDNAVSITIKAQRLTYSRERLLHDSEIFTEARPVFDKTGSSIREYIITHTLMLTTMVDGKFKQKHLSLDNADVLNLHRVCERAILKGRTLKEALVAKGTPTVIVRDEAPSDL